MREDRISRQLLAWYDANARDLPWRVRPADSGAGVRPDPYRVWLSEIMLQQTTVAAVAGYYRTFLRRWPDIHALAAADDADVMAAWAGLGYYARARNLLKCARVVVERHAGEFPRELAELRALPGIGPYTAAAIAAIAFDRPETVIDGNVERVVARLFAVTAPLPAAKRDIGEKAARLTPARRPGDFAQAMMDLGATLCTPRAPQCPRCPVRQHCLGHRAGIAETLPRRAARAARPTRRGIAYVCRRADGALLLERRPDKGLLGGMLGWPCSEWVTEPADNPPLPADWRALPGTVRHTFTHFDLELCVRVATSGMDARPHRGVFTPGDTLSLDDLPTLMRKVHRHAEPALRELGH